MLEFHGAKYYDQFCARWRAKCLIAFATAVAETPAAATTKVAVLNGSNAGNAIRVIAKTAAPAATIIPSNLMSTLLLLLTANPAGHK